MLKEYRTLFPLVKKYSLFYLFGLLTLLLTDAGELYIPQLVKRITNLITGDTFAMDAVGHIVLLMISVALMVALARFGWRFFIHGASRRIERDLRAQVFTHLLGLSSDFFQKMKTGDIMARSSNDMRAIRMASGMALVAFVDGFFLSLAILIILFAQYPKLALITIVPLPFITVIVLAGGKIIGRRFRLVQEGFSRLSEHVQETLTGIRVVKSFVKEEWVEEIFREKNNDNLHRNMQLVRIWGLFFPLITFISGLSLLFLLYFGGEAVILGDFSPGDFIAFMSYLTMLRWPVMGMGFTVNMLQRGAASLKRINEILDYEPCITSPPDAITDPPRGDLSVNKLSFSYKPDFAFDSNRADSPGSTSDSTIGSTAVDSPKNAPDSTPDSTPVGSPGSTSDSAIGSRKNTPDDAPDKTINSTLVLKDISFEVPRGETLGILGRTGSGKSTLVKLLPRLLDPPPGSILIGDRDIRDYQLSLLRASIGIVPQDSFLFSATIRDNLAFGKPDADDEAVLEAAAISTINRELTTFPHGWNTEVGERGLTLSGGQKQRVAISRAMLIDPELLIFDDALASVDAETEEKILAAFLRVRRGRTNILVAHRTSTLQHADRIIVIDDGRIIQHGTHSELIGLPGLYRDIYRLQQFTGKKAV